MSVNEKMTAIADNIRDKTGTAEPLTLDDMARGVNEVYEEGKNAEYDAFWDAIQTKGNNARGYDYMFSSYSWNDTTFKPKYDIHVSYNGGVGTFGGHCGITDLEASLQRANVKLYFEGGNINEMFGSHSLTVLPEVDLRNGCTTYNVFAGKNIHTIRKIISYETTSWSVYSFSRDANNKLANITFDGVIAKDINFQYHSLLTVDSMKSIITHLKNYTGTENAGAYTLTLNDACKTLMAEQGAIEEFDGKTYDAYIADIGWNLA